MAFIDLQNRAMLGKLPKDFDGWDLADTEGWSLAHEAAKWGTLPEGFSQWDLADKYGRTVKQVADERAKKFAEWREETSGKG